MNDDLDTSVLVIDTETTGINKATDQVIELAVQYGFETYTDKGDAIPAPMTVWRFKPDVPIHPGAQKVHGISMEMLDKSPPFKALAHRIAGLLDEALVLIAYNAVFDLDMLTAEFQRAGVQPPDFSKKYIVDPYRLWQRYEPRGLAEAHRRFAGGDFDNAHSAVADIAATGRVALGMIDAFQLHGKDWGEIADLCDPDRKTWLGGSNHFKWVWTNGPDAPPTIVMTFGKHKDTPLPVIAATAGGYLKWMQKQDFPPHVKLLCQKAGSMRGDALLAWAAANFPPPAAPGGGE